LVGACGFQDWAIELQFLAGLLEIHHSPERVVVIIIIIVIIIIVIYG
jgi:hypothetical protein